MFGRRRDAPEALPVACFGIHLSAPAACPQMSYRTANRASGMSVLGRVPANRMTRVAIHLVGADAPPAPPNSGSMYIVGCGHAAGAGDATRYTIYAPLACPYMVRNSRIVPAPRPFRPPSRAPRTAGKTHCARDRIRRASRKDQGASPRHRTARPSYATTPGLQHRQAHPGSGDAARLTAHPAGPPGRDSRSRPPRPAAD